MSSSEDNANFERPPKLLPGPSARYLVRRATRFLLMAVAVAWGMFVSIFLPTPLDKVVVVASFVGMLVFGLRAFRTSISGTRAELRERKAGYTTLSGRRYRHLWQLDSETGAVVRPPEK
jgi:hypothetical protein